MMEKKIWIGSLMVTLSLLILVGCLQTPKNNPNPQPKNIHRPISQEKELKMIENQLAKFHIKSMDINNGIAKLHFAQERIEKEMHRLSARRDEIIQQRHQREKELRNRHFEELIHRRQLLKHRLKELSREARHNFELRPKIEVMQKEVNAINKELEEIERHKHKGKKQHRKRRIREVKEGLKGIERHRVKLDKKIEHVQQEIDQKYDRLEEKEKHLRRELRKLEGRKRHHRR